MTSNQRLLATTAITMLGSMSHAQDVSFRELGQLMTVTGGNDQAAFAFGPEWSEELGFSATGRVGFTLGEGAAVGFIGELGENVTEGMVNLGFHLPNDMSMVFTAGQLRERLEFGDAGDREWVAQDEYGIAINGDNLAFNAYYVDAASTENFLGAMSYGAEIEGSADISENATLAASLGYQRMEWDGDAFEPLEEVTGSVDLAIDVTDTFRLNTYADYNISEAQAGIGASWAIGSGSLDVDYTYIQMDDRSGLADDHRVGLTFSMPIGGAGSAVASRDRTMPGMVTASTQGARRGAGLLAEVMRRPEYLPERVVASGQTICDYTISAFGDGYRLVEGGPFNGDVRVSLQISGPDVEGGLVTYLRANMTVTFNGVENIQDSLQTDQSAYVIHFDTELPTGQQSVSVEINGIACGSFTISPVSGGIQD